MFIKIDHDFVGREPPAKKARKPHRREVTLALGVQDTLRVMSSMFQSEDRAKAVEFLSAVHSIHPFDKVLVNREQVDCQLVSVAAKTRVPCGLS